MDNVRIVALTDAEALAWNLAHELGVGGAFEFILEMDEAVADLGFTKRLRDKLNEIIEEEERDAS